MNEKPYRLRVRLGNSEFEAEGEEALIKEQYQMFLDAVARAHHLGQEEQTSSPVAKPDGTSGNATIHESLVERVFAVDRDGVSLQILPNGTTRAADAVLLLLYGHLRLRNESRVYGTQLMKDARRSGLSIDRIDRVISAHRDFYNRGGQRKGSRYSLNNQGVIKAEQILRSMS